MIRILIGHQDTELPEVDAGRFDVKCVRYRADGQGPPATIAEMLAQCPPDWTPDVYYHAGLVHFPIPADIETFDGLTATNIQDWHRGGRAIWAGAGFFDLILTERNAGEVLKANGYENTHFARFWGVNPQAHRVLPGIERDIDVLFIGSLNPAVWEERNRWLDRLARLSPRYNVVIAMGHYGEHYTRLTNRAKIVFNRSVNGCTNQRAYDAPACGALVFNEEECAEAREAFQDRVHCVFYNDANFEDLLAYYLTHEEERQRIAEAGRQRVLAEHTESAHLNAQFAILEANRNTRYRPAAHLPRAERHFRKAMQIYGSSLPVAAQTALQLLHQAEWEGFDRGRLLEARAALHGWIAHFAEGADKVKLFTMAIDFAKQATKTDPGAAIAQMTLAFLLLERAEVTQGAHPTGRNDIAEAVIALSTAAEIMGGDSGTRDQGPEAGKGQVPVPEPQPLAPIEGFGYPHWNDLFDARMERAYLLRDVDRNAWAEEIRATVAWRCHAMLSDLAYANAQREEAYRQAEAATRVLPVEAEGWLRLARCEAATGRLEAAVQHYRAGFALSPLAYAAWPELAAVLMALGRHAEALEFVEERLHIIKAAPSLAAIRPALMEAIGIHG